MKKIVFVLSIPFLLLAASCERVLMSEGEQPTAVATFDALWQRIDEQYSMFDVKGVDWLAVRDSLRPKVYDGMKSDSLFAVCAAMLNTLHDGHVNLLSSVDISHADSLVYHFYSYNDIDINALMEGYLGTDFHTTGGMIHKGLRGNRVIYTRYSSFSNTISVSQLRYIISRYPKAEGMIIDVRGNGGGNLANVSNILKVMPSHGQLLYSSQIKAGKGHDDFTPLVGTYAAVTADSAAYKKPVVVLIDRGCFSATSTFAISTQAYDNIILMGDTTSGGLGLPAVFVLPNGWRCRFSITRTIALDGGNYENGVPPDVPIRLDRQGALLLRQDNIIEAACQHILAPAH